MRTILAVLLLSFATEASAQTPPPPQNCPACDLSNLDLSGANLTRANFSGAKLTGTKLTGAVLDGAMFNGADLSGVVLDNASLLDTSLSRANLSGASLHGAKLGRTDLQYAQLAGAVLSGLDLTEAITGPRMNVGTAAGRKTQLDGVRLYRGTAVDAAGANLTGVEWVDRPLLAVAASGAELVCGNADLSALEHFIYVSPAGADVSDCGASTASACATIQAGIAHCTAPRCGVLVGWGQYTVTDPVKLVAGVNVYGGCLPPDAADSVYDSSVTAKAGYAPAMIADNIGVATVLQNFEISTQAASGALIANVALSMSNSPALSIVDTKIYANSGAKGRDAGPPPPGAATGGNGSGQNGGTNPACPTATGGKGGSKMTVSVSEGWMTTDCKKHCSENDCKGYPANAASPTLDGAYAHGGGTGKTKCEWCGAHDAGRGDDGEKGPDGTCGAIGLASLDTHGHFAGTTWIGSIGNAGGNGGTAGGGGGGGAGGYSGETCLGEKTEYPGNPGGGGGAGGCGGIGGLGASQGGGSFAIVAVASTVNLTNCRVVGGRGGDGGKGGERGTSGIGGKGAPGKTDGNGQGGDGGTGGDGGIGGAPGGGAAGNGGPAINIALVSGSTLAGTPIDYPGASGAPGVGGVGNSNTLCGTPRSDGQTGYPGTVAPTWFF